MHDPYILIGRFAGLTLWHKDPEKDGSDDSCGWPWPRFSDDQHKRLARLAWCESYKPVFQAHYGKSFDEPAHVEALLRGALLQTATALRVRVSADEVVLWSAEMACLNDDCYRTLLAFLPGWHSNQDVDNQESRKHHARNLFSACGRWILREKRRWWQHPRWHFWHWRVGCDWLFRIARYRGTTR